MFTIEHDFDASVITLVDEGPAPLQEDVSVTNFDRAFHLSQYNETTGRTAQITLSLRQLRDLAAALDLPEGMYSTEIDKKGKAP